MSSERKAAASSLVRRLTLPGASLVLCTVAVGLYIWPAAAEIFQFDRDAVAAGQYYRGITGHATHWSLDHLVWDVLAFAALGSVCEMMSRKKFFLCLLLAALLIPLGVWFWLPQMNFYRGLSGLDSALFALLAMEIGRRDLRERNWFRVGAIAALAAAFTGKLAVEFFGGDALFVQNMEGAVPVPLAHLIGATVGCAVALFPPGWIAQRKANLRAGLAAFLIFPISAIAIGADESAPPSEEDAKETIVLLHGMGRSRASMLVMRSRFEDAGYEVLNFPYATATKTLDEISDDLKDYVRENVKTDRYHFVAHSLGNVIIRNGFRTDYPEGLGRIVMIAPPNQPADLGKMFRDFKPFQWITGDSGQKIGDAAFYADLPTPSVEFGIIAGDRGQKLTFDQKNDGVVTVEGTKLEGMADWKVLHHMHTTIMNSKDTAKHCLAFLRDGKFDSENAEEVSSE